METLLEIHNLTKKYNEFTLDNVSFCLPKGSIMGFVGENGAGKTTTIKAILNMIKKDSGTITVFGKDSVQYEAQIKEEIGVVLDDGFFYETITPKNINTILKGVYSNWDSQLFFEYLKQFNLPSNKPIKELSKGMKMKLSIMIALSHHCKLLILDEPTSGLDPIVRSEILDLFLEFIQDEEKSILFSSHITSDLEKIADYITFINDGRIIFTKERDELFDQFGVLKCGVNDFDTIDKKDITRYLKNKFGYEILVENKKMIKKKYPNLVIDPIKIDELMLFYIKGVK